MAFVDDRDMPMDGDDKEIPPDTDGLSQTWYEPPEGLDFLEGEVLGIEKKNFILGLWYGCAGAYIIMQQQGWIPDNGVVTLVVLASLAFTVIIGVFLWLRNFDANRSDRDEENELNLELLAFSIAVGLAIIAIFWIGRTVVYYCAYQL